MLAPGGEADLLHSSVQVRVGAVPGDQDGELDQPCL
jgi:hypothetical protein